MKPGLVARLMLGYAAVIVAVLFSAARSREAAAAAELTAQALAERSIQAVELAAELETLMHEKSYVSNYLLSGDPSYLSVSHSHRQEFEAWIEHMASFAGTPGERDLVGEIRKDYLAYVAAGDEVERLGMEGRQAEARDVFFSMKRDVDQLLAQGQLLFSSASDDLREQRAAAHATIQRGQIVSFWLTAVGAVLSLLMGFVLARYAALPLYKLVLRLGEEGGTDQFQFKGDEIQQLESHVNALLERVRRQERALQQGAKLSELGEIAAEIAHETLNPLAGVKGMLQALRRTSLPAERVARELGDMERELTRVERIVRRLVRYARPLEPHLSRVRLLDVLQGARASAARTPGAASRELIVAAHDPELTWVMDPELMEQVLVNLIINAWEASPPGTPVELRVERAGEGLALTVRDHGAGLPDGSGDRLFHPFFTTKPDGNGLGLAVSRNIVEEHGGRIFAHAADGGGTLFTVVLPEGGQAWASPSSSSMTRS